MREGLCKYNHHELINTRTTQKEGQGLFLKTATFSDDVLNKVKALRGVIVHFYECTESDLTKKGNI